TAAAAAAAGELGLSLPQLDGEGGTTAAAGDGNMNLQEVDGAIRMYLSCLSNMFSLIVATCHALDNRTIWPEIVRLKDQHVAVKSDLKRLSRSIKSSTGSRTGRAAVASSLDPLNFDTEVVP
ncbi:hypothetical protein HK405_004742, partial [Cladochytrium tenue]